MFAKLQMGRDVTRNYRQVVRSDYNNPPKLSRKSKSSRKQSKSDFKKQMKSAKVSKNAAMMLSKPPPSPEFLPKPSLAQSQSQPVPSELTKVRLFFTTKVRLFLLTYTSLILDYYIHF